MKFSDCNDGCALPNSWDCLELGLLGEWSGGGTPSKGNAAFWTNGSIPWISPKDMKCLEIYRTEDYITKEAVGNSATKVIPENSLIMVTRSGILRHTFPVAINKVQAALNQDLKALTPANGISAKFVAYYLILSNDRVLTSCAKDGTTVQSVETERLRKFEVPIAPEAEQARIVSKIEELFSDLDKGEESLRQSQAQLKRYRQSVLKAAVTGELTRDWREKNKGRLEAGEALLKRILKARREAWEKAELEKMRAKGVKPKDDLWKKKYVEPKGPDTTGLPELPDGWVWASMGQLLCKIEAGKNFKCEERPPKDGEVGIVKVSAVTWGIFDENESKTITNAKKVDERYVIHEGDFLFSRANTIDLVGACLIVCDFEKRLLLSDKILRFVFAFDLKQWVDISLKSNAGREQIKNYSSGNQESMRNISQDNIYKIAIPLPSLEEIRQTLNSYSLLTEEGNALGSHVELSQSNLKQLRQSILKSAFSGTLVPQDPSDEPASELLKHIAAEKGAPASSSAARRVGPRQKKREALAPAKQPELPTSLPQKQTAPGLAQFRKAAGMSQAELAKAIGLNQAYISQMETGKRAISNEVAKAISRVLDVDPKSFAV